MLEFSQCPGDTLAATAAIHSLKQLYPELSISARGVAVAEVCANNPSISPYREGMTIRMDNFFWTETNKRPVSFLDTWCEPIRRTLQIPLQLSTTHPLLYLTAQEQIPFLSGKYVVINAGFKNDYTVKAWNKYQDVVDALKHKIKFVQVGEAAHNHKVLAGAVNLIGKTDTRALIKLCYNAVLGIGAESFTHHIFAAFRKPYVCLLSGMLPAAYLSYPTARLVHAQGLLDCCRYGGCDRARVVALGDGDEKDTRLCKLPVLGEIPTGQCMDMIGASRVIEEVEQLL